MREGCCVDRRRVVTDRWQVFSEYEVNADNLAELAEYADELLVGALSCKQKSWKCVCQAEHSDCFALNVVRICWMSFTGDVLATVWRAHPSARLEPTSIAVGTCRYRRRELVFSG